MGRSFAHVFSCVTRNENKNVDFAWRNKIGTNGVIGKSALEGWAHLGKFFCPKEYIAT